MQELRTDEVTGTCVIVAPGRATRPVVFSAPAATTTSALDSCPFCAGHESMTPPEVARAGAGEPDTPGWQVRVVPNLYPIVGQEPGIPGAHDVFVLSPAHDFEQGTVASVKVVLPDVPGQGQPPRLIVEPVLNMIPFAVVDVADMGYNPWCEVQLMLFGLI